MTAVQVAGRRSHFSDLLRELVGRDIRLRYSGSVLGLGWSQVSALAQTAVLMFVFSRVVRLGIPNYAAFVIVGMLPWLWFVGGVGAAAESIVSGRDLVRRPGFPAAVLPLVSVGTSLINFALTIPVMLIAVGVVTGGLPATATLLPLVAGVQLLVMLGPAYLVATLYVFLRDTGHLVAVVLGLLFYATPIIYQHVPHRYHFILTLNPMAHLVTDYRRVLLDGTLPSWPGMVTLSLGGGAATYLCYRLFASRRRWFAEEL